MYVMRNSGHPQTVRAIKYSSVLRGYGDGVFSRLPCKCVTDGKLEYLVVRDRPPKCEKFGIQSPHMEFPKRGDTFTRWLGRWLNFSQL